jgi:FtsP/CotA-like multicopper oxidase with cupredoxin domain
VVLVQAMGSVTVLLDADNPGQWALHCHNEYHMAAGMMTSIRYEA